LKFIIYHYNLISIIGKIKNLFLMLENGHFSNFIKKQSLSKENQKILTPIRAYDIK